MKYLIFLCLVFNSCGITITRGNSELSKTAQKAESYIIKTQKLKPNVTHQSIEFGELKIFDLNNLLSEYEIPTIYEDSPWAHAFNRNAFAWIKTLNNTKRISYSMSYIYGWRENKSDPWTPYWTIVLFDNDYNVIGAVQYQP